MNVASRFTSRSMAPAHDPAGAFQRSGDRHARLATAERKRMIDANQMLSIGKLLAVQAAFVEIIKSEIGDQPQVLANISRR